MSNNQSAFPYTKMTYGQAQKSVEGMSLRDYFAAKALPVAWAALEEGYFEADEYNSAQRMAECAYQLADAMLSERNKGNKND